LFDLRSCLPAFSAGPATEICKVDVQSMDGPQDSLGFASLELDHKFSSACKQYRRRAQR
jgi:hypothetical protein